MNKPLLITTKQYEEYCNNHNVLNWHWFRPIVMSFNDDTLTVENEHSSWDETMMIVLQPSEQTYIEFVVVKRALDGAGNVVLTLKSLQKLQKLPPLWRIKVRKFIYDYKFVLSFSTIGAIIKLLWELL